MLSQNVVFALCSVLILVVGGQAVGAGSMSVGELITFYIAFGLWNAYLKTIANSVPVILLGEEGLRALHELISIEDRPVYEGTNQIVFSGNVVLEDVDFAYDETPLLLKTNFEIQPGELTLLMGPNGVGKSTLINLILGFYRPQVGVVYADGQPYDALDVGDLRRQMGVVMQDPIIFPGSIAENIGYGCADVEREQIVRAAALSGAHEFIAQLPQGYRTSVGENGMLLSGGQRQRIAIARALLRSPRLLILDEPTNHLDSDGMTHLMQRLRTLEHAPAILMISHNAALMQQADRVYVLDGELRAIQSAKESLGMTAGG
jgi:ABC-type bacteriocin/lantibiotic exporter with double-glycine peptidase domain